MEYPVCLRCSKGVLLPFSDYGQTSNGSSSPIEYKAWVCNNPECHYQMTIIRGQVHVNVPVLTTK